jgi:hypothetical protein
MRADPHGRRALRVLLPASPLTDQALVTFRLRANTASVHETAAHVTDHPASQSSVGKARTAMAVCRPRSGAPERVAIILDQLGAWRIPEDIAG